MGYLRFFLAAVVVMSHSAHAWLPARAGSLSVETFFIISGFYMQLVIGDYAAAGGHWIRRFYSSRLMRLLPLYYAVLLITIIFILGTHGISTPTTHFCQGTAMAVSECLFPNLFIIGQDVLHFVWFNITTGQFQLGHSGSADFIIGHHFIIVAQAWSLALEVMFYALVPFLLLRSTMIVACVMLASLLIKIAVAASSLPGIALDWNYAFFPAELCAFLMGSLACRHMMSRKPKKSFAPMRQHYAPNPIWIYFLLLGTCASIQYGDLAFLILTAVLLPSLFRRQSMFDRMAGECSYPIYMTHMLIMQIFNYSGWRDGMALFILSLTFATITALIYNYLIDIPLTRYRHRRFKKRVAEE